MQLPTLNELAITRDMIDTFGGYNHNLRIGANEFYDMKNLTSEYYPSIAPRRARGYFKTTYTPLGLIEKDALCYVAVSGNELLFIMNGEEYNLGLTEYSDDTERQLVSMGAYVIIMPDKKYFNTVDTADKGNIEEKYVSGDGVTVSFCLCKMDGTVYEIDMTGTDEPISSKENPLPNGYTWLDTSGDTPSLKQYSSTSGMWSSVATTYIKITATGIGKVFEEYDGVRLTGITVESLADDYNDKTHVIYARGDDFIVVVGLLGDPNGYSQNEQIMVERFMPDTDFLIESNNRLWGCRYGLNRDGEVVNEIYACKQGDFKNWNCFLGVSTDSYYASVGTDGQFTGAFAYLGQPTFFKENCIHIVYGSYPAQYQIQDTVCRGVQKGSEKSLAMVNEVLYYKSRTGICAYSGSLPVEISEILGENSYCEAVGAGNKNKYYITMKNKATRQYEFFVFDTAKGLWHKEDNLTALRFCPIDDEIYYIDGEEKTVKTLFGSGVTDQKPIKWMAETGTLGLSSPDKKYISRLNIRLVMEIGARAVFSVQYDSSGIWEQICSLTGHNLRTFTLPVRPKRCDHFKLRIEGVGHVKIFSISKITEDGSDDD